MKRPWEVAVVVGGFLFLGGCGTAPEDPAGGSPVEVNSAVTGTPVFSGKLSVSTLSTTVGSPIVVSESATNLIQNQVGPIILGIRRLGFTVTGVVKPATGICRIAGSATCNFVELQPGQTQTYQLTLVANTPGTYQLQGWATSTSVPGGASESVLVTVK